MVGLGSSKWSTPSCSHFPWSSHPGGFVGHVHARHYQVPLALLDAGHLHQKLGCRGHGNFMQFDWRKKPMKMMMKYWTIWTIWTMAFRWYQTILYWDKTIWWWWWWWWWWWRWRWSIGMYWTIRTMGLTMAFRWYQTISPWENQQSDGGDAGFNTLRWTSGKTFPEWVTQCSRRSKRPSLVYLKII